MLRGDAAFALPNLYEYLEAEGFQYAIRLPVNAVLQERIALLLTRPVGRPSHYVWRFYATFRYQARSRSPPRRVVAKVEWHPGELYPPVGFIVTKLRRPARTVVAFYNGCGTAEQWIEEGKQAVKWTRLSCTAFRANAVRLHAHALAYHLAASWTGSRGCVRRTWPHADARSARWGAGCRDAPGVRQWGA